MTKSEQMLQDIETNGVAGKGKKEMVRHLEGERLTTRQMIIAKCYDCMGYYSDGRGQDCEIPECSLYPLMPYRKLGEKYVGKKSISLSEEHKAKMKAGRNHKNQK